MQQVWSMQFQQPVLSTPTTVAGRAKMGTVMFTWSHKVWHFDIKGMRRIELTEYNNWVRSVVDSVVEPHTALFPMFQLLMPRCHPVLKLLLAHYFGNVNPNVSLHTC